MKYLLLLYCLFLSNKAFTQVAPLDSLLENKNYTIFKRELTQLHLPDKDSSLHWYYQGKLQLKQRNIAKAFIALKKVDSTQLPQAYKAWYYYVLGDTYRYNNQEEKAYALKLKAQKLFNTGGNIKMANAINYDLHYTLVSQDFLEYDGESYLKTFFENANQNDNVEQLLTAHLGLSFLGITPKNTKNARFHLKKASLYANTIGTPIAMYKLHNYKAVFYQSYTDDLKQTEIHIDSMLYYANILDSPDRMDSSLKTKAYTHTLQGNYNEAIATLLKAEDLPIKENVYNRKRGLYQYLSLNYENLNKIDSAYFYYKRMVSYRDSINITEQNIILTLLETTELSQKNLVLDAERIKHKNRSYLSISISIAVVIIGVILILYYRNKKELAEKEKELRAIDARNEEKDFQRQRIAGELHDNLGGLIIAIQQSFDNIKASKDRFQQEEENLISKTRKLLDEAYQKVRNMAHLEDSASRNSGYWVDIIKDFAAIINESNQLSVEVQSHGTSDIINVSVENDLRRMTTELITNAVKHSKSSEVSVDITADENAITIIVEDNGVGLDITQIKKQKGLGLYSMERKIEELKGKLVIDSNPNKGSTFIIEIPL
ncbi:sensor histidine kinase [Aquimarina sp. 2201CG5-10]|uniref:sensor histidine kinase n=1 Tax=Aquimarina callyspongiae TaxID=3098150 RepID=UPI002AB4C1E9|nr:ATP-binding protein [Aquimarina sp. 2201CG5-10]MDY8134682.1 ATP-binding protein [Aquimarina sp. 2201CG5-10]